MEQLARQNNDEISVWKGRKAHEQNTQKLGATALGLVSAQSSAHPLQSAPSRIARALGIWGTALARVQNQEKKGLVVNHEQ